MDCIRQISSERRRLDERTLSPAFHLAVIEKALRFIDEQLPGPGARLQADEAAELRAACEEALEALADLRTGRR
ncbi:hypothetical protein [Hyphomonas sp.]|uniref:hypothetical protein n=1 Tax=Hyphomonas sp. TaxID=87 RepID=UPI0025BBAEEC|nr:hypothetical protein [Hyphomonas sp.]